MSFPPAEGISDWNAIDLGDGLYEIYNTFTCTGAAVAHALNINYKFELLAIYLQHVDATLALSTDALTWSFNRLKEFAQPFPIVTYTASAVSNFLELFGGLEFNMPSGPFTLSENSTNTDLVHVRLLVRVII